MRTLKVIKIGGNIIDDEVELSRFLESFSKLSAPKILVHGGGKLATKMAKELDVPVKMIEGRRITDKETLDIITMVYAGKINKNIVSQLQSYNCNSIGFTGADGNTIKSKKREVSNVDYGFVGDVEQVNTDVLHLLLENSVTPVFCAITHNKKGQLLNTNADTIASEIAIAFSKKYNVELYYCFEKNGVLKSIQDEDSVIESISYQKYVALKQAGVIAEGMIPKLDNCFNALTNNVSKVCIGKPSMLFNQNQKFTTLK